MVLLLPYLLLSLPVFSLANTVRHHRSYYNG
jgi:hypothetical protein